MAISKVTLNGETLMDVTGDTVTENNMLYGIKATAANGNSVTGTVVTTPVDNTLDVSSSNAIQNQAVAIALSNKADTSTIPSATSDLSNNSYFVSDSNYTHTDNNFTTTLKDKLDGIASGATVDDHKWNDVTLSKSYLNNQSSLIIPIISGSTAYYYNGTQTPTANKIAMYDSSSYLNSTTPTLGDSSTKVATTAFVESAISIGLSSYVLSSRTINGKALSSDITLSASDVGALPSSTSIPSATSDLSNNSYFVADSSYVHTDNNFTAALKTKLEGIESSATVDDHKWNTKGLTIQDATYEGETNYIPIFMSLSAIDANLTKATRVPTAHAIPKYNADAYLVATTPSTSDNSTLVATTAFVNAAIAASGGGAGASIEVVRLL